MKMAALISGVLCLATASAASAATLTPVSGSVLLNTGAGYKPVSGSVEVKPGDSILVNAGGKAELAYGVCATYEITPGDVVYVAEDKSIPCAGAVLGAGGGIGTGTLLIGAAAVAVGVGIVVGVSSGSDSPASP